MSALDISIEGMSEALFAAYVASGMDRAKLGKAALEWAFNSTTANPFAVARIGGEIVGVSAYIESRMQFGSAVGVGAQAVDSFVFEQARGRGVFTKLAQAYDDYAKQTGIDLVWGFPNANAAPAWFTKLGWHRHGQVPFLVKPLNASYALRKLGLAVNLPLGFSKDQNLSAINEIGDWGDRLWQNAAEHVGVATVRDKAFLQHRLFASPNAASYRVVADDDAQQPALLATCEASKHGGSIAYIMEALGGESLEALLASEIGRLRAKGCEMLLAWSFPSSPNYKALRRMGFLPLPVALRPVTIWFGTSPKTDIAASANLRNKWYLSYLDSDTL